VIAVAVIVVLVLLGLAASVRVLKQYERGVQFRLGRVKDGARGPGLIFIIPLVDRLPRVSLRIVTMPIQSQGIITRPDVLIDRVRLRQRLVERVAPDDRAQCRLGDLVDRRGHVLDRDDGSATR